jgi:hypothetical protein
MSPSLCVSSNCHVLSCLVLSCLVLLFCLVLSCLVLSCFFVLSCLVLSCLVLSCYIYRKYIYRLQHTAGTNIVNDDVLLTYPPLSLSAVQGCTSSERSESHGDTTHISPARLVFRSRAFAFALSEFVLYCLVLSCDCRVLSGLFLSCTYLALSYLVQSCSCLEVIF